MLSVFNRAPDTNNGTGTRHVRAHQFSLGPDRSGLAYTLGARQDMTCQCPWGTTGLDWSIPLGQSRPGLYPWGRAGLDWSMPLGQNRPKVAIAHGELQAWTCQCLWQVQDRPRDAHALNSRTRL